MPPLILCQTPATINSQATEKRRVQLKRKAGRFRILIIGRANAGKTTILKKICGTTDDPEIYTKYGRKIDASSLEPSTLRGLHDIENEIVFQSSPQFIFHDSRGFEAGGDDELKKVNDFILVCSKERRLRDQIHVIWYCIPMDDDRPITHVENQFFSQVGTGKVPVIAVFTKCEALEVKAVIALEDQGFTYKQAMENAQEYVQKNMKNAHVVLEKKEYPPRSHVYLQELNKPERQCLDLVESTVAVLDGDILQAVFISVQQNNLELSMKYALRWGIRESWRAKTVEATLDFMLKKVFGYFPYYVSNQGSTQTYFN